MPSYDRNLKETLDSNDLMESSSRSITSSSLPCCLLVVSKSLSGRYLRTSRVWAHFLKATSRSWNSDRDRDLLIDPDWLSLWKKRLFNLQNRERQDFFHFSLIYYSLFEKETSFASGPLLFIVNSRFLPRWIILFSIWSSISSEKKKKKRIASAPNKWMKSLFFARKNCPEADIIFSPKVIPRRKFIQRWEIESKVNLVGTYFFSSVLEIPDRKRPLPHPQL